MHALNRLLTFVDEIKNNPIQKGCSAEQVTQGNLSSVFDFFGWLYGSITDPSPSQLIAGAHVLPAISSPLYLIYRLARDGKWAEAAEFFWMVQGAPVALYTLPFALKYLRERFSLGIIQADITVRSLPEVQQGMWGWKALISPLADSL